MLHKVSHAWQLGNPVLGGQDADNVIFCEEINGNPNYSTNRLTAGGRIHFAGVANGLAQTSVDFAVV